MTWIAIGTILFVIYIASFWRIDRDFDGNDGCADARKWPLA